MNNIKVAHISEDGRGGGQFQYIRDLVSDSVLKQVIISPLAKNDDKANQLHSKINYISLSLRVLNFKNFLAYIIYLIPEVIKLIKVIRAENFDLIVCHSAIQIKGVIVAYILNKPCIWVMHDSYLSGLSKVIFTPISRLCKNYLFVSDRSKEYYNKSFKHISYKNQIVIPSCIDHNQYFPENSSLLTADRFNVITTCYINKWKGLELLIDIAYQCKISGSTDIQFHIIGPILESRKTYAASLTKRIDELQLDNIEFHGYASNINEFLNSAQLYLCTSTYESSPISIWEAMATGLPILSYDVGDLNKIIAKYHCGKIITTRDPKLFFQNIEYYKSDPSLLKEQGNNSYKATFELFNKKCFIENHQNFYQSVVESHYENRPRK